MAITLTEIEEKHRYTFPPLFRSLWEDDMLNWMRGFETPLPEGKSWAEDVYPTLKEKAPLFLHTGGYDFELFTPEQMLNFEFPELWDSENHHFIPFAKTQEGIVYAFYANIDIEGENPVVLIWDEMDEAEIIAKNFEDFIFRKMLMATEDLDKEDLQADYGKEDPMLTYQQDILLDLKSISPYLKQSYVDLLTEQYHGQIKETLISYGIEGPHTSSELIAAHLEFEQLDEAFSYEKEA